VSVVSAGDEIAVQCEGMRPLLKWLKQYGFFPVLLAVMVVAVGGLVYLASWLTINQEGQRVLGTPLVISPTQPIHTPEAPFAPLNPAILAYLESGQPEVGAISLQVVGGDIPAIGAYLPRTGNRQFEFVQATALPTPLAYPTSPTLPYPTSPPIPPTLPPPSPVPSATLDLVATVLAFDAAVQPQPFFYPGSCAPSGRPLEGLLTQYFTGYHSGIDISIPSGTPVLATQSGIVTWADWNTFGYGNLVIIQSDRYITYYAHLTSFNVLLGQQVQKGSLIAFSGNTGRSSGPHIHYETRIDDVPVNPLTFEARGLVTC
jgi:murein DD-endopeptidase MepM/ murein hydrolase activator NlpD